MFQTDKHTLGTLVFKETKKNPMSQNGNL